MKPLQKNRFTSLFDNKVFWILVIVMLTAAIYIRVVNFGFINWDDDRNIYNNENIKNLTFKGIRHIFSSFELNMYQPLTTLTYAIEYRFFGLKPGYYHFDNLLLHLLNSLLVFVFIRKLSENTLIAGISGVLFGIHPLHTESVAWVTERKDVLYTFFFLASLIFYQRFLTNRKKYLMYTISLILFLFSLMSKSAAVILPLILILIDYYNGNALKLKFLLNKIPFFLAALGFGILSLYSQHVIENPGLVIYHFSFADRLIFGVYALFFYISKAFWPFQLSAFHPFPIKTGLFLPLKFYIGAGTILVFIAIIILVYLKKWLVKNDFKNVLWGLFFFSITIAIILFIPVGSAYVAERYTYLPYLGLFFLIGFLINKIITTDIKFSPTLRYISLTFALVVTAGISSLTYQRLSVWKNSLSFWNNVIENYPQKAPLAYYNRGVTYYELSKYALAIENYTAAIKQKPDYFDAYYSRALARFKISDFNGALADYNFFLSYNPSNPDALINRGQILGQTGDIDGAMADFNKAISLKPGDYLPWFNRAVINYISGNTDLSIQDFYQAIRLNPGYALSYYYRGLVYKSSGHRAEACDDLNKALQLGYQDAASVITGYCN